jgi:hypothetical protein
MIATIDNETYRLSTNVHKGRDYIVIERLCSDAQTVEERYFVRQPHPAYRDGQWQPEHFKKLIKSGQVMKRKSRGGT